MPRHTITTKVNFIPVNGDMKDFRLQFTVVCKDIFYIAVVNRHMMDTTTNFPFVRVESGKYSNEQDVYEDVQQEYYLAIRAEKTCECEVEMSVTPLPSMSAPVPEPPTVPIPPPQPVMRQQPIVVPAPVESTGSFLNGYTVLGIIAVLGAFAFYYMTSKKNENGVVSRPSAYPNIPSLRRRALPTEVNPTPAVASAPTVVPTVSAPSVVPTPSPAPEVVVPATESRPSLADRVRALDF